LRVATQDYNKAMAEHNIARGQIPGGIRHPLCFQREEEFKVDPAKREVPNIKFEVLNRPYRVIVSTFDNVRLPG